MPDRPSDKSRPRPAPQPSEIASVADLSAQNKSPKRTRRKLTVMWTIVAGVALIAAIGLVWFFSGPPPEKSTAKPRRSKTKSDAAAIAENDAEHNTDNGELKNSVPRPTVKTVTCRVYTPEP